MKNKRKWIAAYLPGGALLSFDVFVFLSATSPFISPLSRPLSERASPVGNLRRQPSFRRLTVGSARLPTAATGVSYASVLLLFFLWMDYCLQWCARILVMSMLCSFDKGCVITSLDERSVYIFAGSLSLFSLPRSLLFFFIAFFIFIIIRFFLSCLHIFFISFLWQPALLIVIQFSFVLSVIIIAAGTSQHGSLRILTIHPYFYISFYFIHYL